MSDSMANKVFSQGYEWNLNREKLYPVCFQQISRLGKNLDQVSRIETSLGVISEARHVIDWSGISIRDVARQPGGRP